jgi:hypothetical protein
MYFAICFPLLPLDINLEGTQLVETLRFKLEGRGFDFFF